jgi:hypothetical protein
MDKVEKKEIVKKVQSALGFTGSQVDGIDGQMTWSAILNKLVDNTTQPEPVEVQESTASGLSKAALDLIIKHEVGGGEAYYNKALKSPCYPGGASGVTIGIGYDIGYNDLKQFEGDWKQHLSSDTFKRLSAHLGKKSDTAKAAVSSVKDITIPWAIAFEVFKSRTLPRFIKETIKAFPGSDKLHADAFGALVSLVFNRGGSTTGSSRQEMLNIKRAIAGDTNASNIYNYIADQIVAMKRLWVGKNLPGLLKRRDEEAALVRNSKK